MQFYVGVVENRYDPLKLGRCQVRVAGLHTEDKNDLPTRDLPWAYPLQPITSAAMSGIGHAPVGPVEGTWCLVIFRDNDCQLPIMLGTFGGVPSDPNETLTAENVVAGASDQLSFVETIQDTILGALLQSLGIGGATTTSTTTTSTTTTPTSVTTSTTTSTTPINEDSLGSTSEEFESGGKGPGTINDYNGSMKNDPGGASYGTYQLASFLPAVMGNGNPRKKVNNSPVLDFVNSCRFSQLFSGLTPATSAFDNKWKECASKYATDFKKEQHSYIKRKYYDVACKSLKSLGFDHTKFGMGCQDMIWSTAVQFGPAAPASIWQKALNGTYSISEVELITKVQDYKINNVATMFKSSPASIQQSMKARATKEKTKLLALAGTGKAATTAKPVDGSTSELSSENPANFNTESSNTQAIENSVIGFRDPTKKYPLYIKEQDTSRLARNSNVNDTIIQKRDDNRVQGISAANNFIIWDEPVSPYAAAYPYNHVYQGESGHVMEFDDTEGAERIHLYHKAGTYTEIDKNGRQVNRIVGDGYQIIDRNGYIYVAGNCNITVGGNAQIYAQGDLNIQADGDTVVTSNNDVTWNVSGNMDLSVAESFRLHAKSVAIESDSTTNLYSEGALSLMTNSTLTGYAASVLKLTSGGAMNIRSMEALKLTGKTSELVGTDTLKMSSKDVNLKGTTNTKVFGATLNLKGSTTAILDGGTTANVKGSIVNLGNGIVNTNSGSVPSAATASDATEADKIVPITYNAETGAPTNTDGNFAPPKSKLANANARANPTYPTYPDLATSSRTLQVDQAFETEGALTDSVKKEMIAKGYAKEGDFDIQPAEIEKSDVKGRGGVGIAVDNKVIDGMKEFPDSFKLSPNFTIAHITTKAAASPTKLRAVFNQTEQDIVKNLQGVALNILEPIIKEFPTMIVTSGFRDYNTAGTLSQHCKGQAVDMQFKVAPGEYFNVAKRIIEIVPVFDQLLLEYKSTGTKLPWIHMSYNPSGNRGQVMTFFNHSKHSSGLTKLV